MTLKPTHVPRSIFVNFTVSKEANISNLSRLELSELVEVRGKQYKVRGVTQYNHNMRHFRTVKNLYIDGMMRWYILDEPTQKVRGRFPVDVINPQHPWYISTIQLDEFSPRDNQSNISHRQSTSIDNSIVSTINILEGLEDKE